MNNHGAWSRFPAVPKTKRQFQVEIEAKILVDAFDEASARKKIEKALSPGKALDADVQATGEVWTYAATKVTGA
jgi:hypothetical protein